jgi:hypothetical protein
MEYRLVNSAHHQYALREKDMIRVIVSPYRLVFLEQFRLSKAQVKRIFRDTLGFVRSPYNYTRWRFRVCRRWAVEMPLQIGCERFNDEQTQILRRWAA